MFNCAIFWEFVELTHRKFTSLKYCNVIRNTKKKQDFFFDKDHIMCFDYDYEC